ncbi:hypothetical protein Ancab_007778 [Ancistrocladus abbreviatus]
MGVVIGERETVRSPVRSSRSFLNSISISLSFIFHFFPPNNIILQLCGAILLPILKFLSPTLINLFIFLLLLFFQISISPSSLRQTLFDQTHRVD